MKTLFSVLLLVVSLASCASHGPTAATVSVSNPTTCVDTPKEKCPSLTYLRLVDRSKKLPDEIQEQMKKPDVENYLRIVDEQYSISNQLSQANQQMAQQGYKFDETLAKFIVQPPTAPAGVPGPTPAVVPPAPAKKK